MLPPNCDNPNYYKSLGVHELCKILHEQNIKNPVSYPFRLLKIKSENKKQKKFKKNFKG
jgi:hypothetical protein